MVADAIQRWSLNYSGSDRGLRGGRWSYTGTRLVRFRFRAARFTRDVPVSGTATWRLGTGAVRADLRIGRRGHLRARWNLRRPLARATIAGAIDGRRLQHHDSRAVNRRELNRALLARQLLLRRTDMPVADGGRAPRRAAGAGADAAVLRRCGRVWRASTRTCSGGC